MWTKDTIEFLLSMCQEMQVQCVDPDSPQTCNKVRKLYEQASEELRQIDIRLKTAISRSSQMPDTSAALAQLNASIEKLKTKTTLS